MIARHPATRLTVRVEVEHLGNRETTVIHRRDWLPDAIGELADDRRHHHELLDAVDGTGVKVRELKASLPQERKRCVMARVAGETRPRADGNPAVEEAEEAALATVVVLIRDCDEILGRLAPKLDQWIADDEAQRAALTAEIEAKERELRELRERRRSGYALHGWLTRTRTLATLPSWRALKNFVPRHERGQTPEQVAAEVKAMRGWG